MLLKRFSTVGREMTEFMSATSGTRIVKLLRASRSISPSTAAVQIDHNAVKPLAKAKQIVNGRRLVCIAPRIDVIAHKLNRSIRAPTSAAGTCEPRRDEVRLRRSKTAAGHAPQYRPAETRSPSEESARPSVATRVVLPTPPAME